MHIDTMVFVLAIIALTSGGWIVNNWLRMKHGYAPTDKRGNPLPGTAGPDAQRKIDLLSNENDRLTGQISRLEERIAVLERIATDPAERTAREIDSLR
ncbi:hypothetical protein OF829_13905 [Sphingomonas sp. LB-2]|uniref:hypothetical protein n=1 Tax=Sphingomonas caeni TaxID=2984949 RepID=UPI0022322646|nr:hypothetical protein [Sphingomonas caeni]MCW3848335.1 hypothetical protein [Sphingomonas caeni]